MPASRYDIYAEQGSTFKLHFHYKYSGGTGIDLSSYTGQLQVRRSVKDEKAILFLSTSGVTGGGITGEFIPGINGIAGVGGISFNTSIDGTALTGGILFKIDSNTMKNTPSGKHFYDFELVNNAGDVTRLTEGSFDISREITRIP
jgi:hypothetical protein